MTNIVTLRLVVKYVWLAASTMLVFVMTDDVPMNDILSSSLYVLVGTNCKMAWSLTRSNTYACELIS